jgi:hypothetical protein
VTIDQQTEPRMTDRRPRRVSAPGHRALRAGTDALASGAAGLRPRGRGDLESAATYWHLVDLLWIILFALLYLMT